MDLERGYQIEIPSKQYYSTSIKDGGNITLNPYFITGFTDAEGSFTVTIYSDKLMSTGIRVNAEFKIGLNERDKKLTP